MGLRGMAADCEEQTGTEFDELAHEATGLKELVVQANGKRLRSRGDGLEEFPGELVEPTASACAHKATGLKEPDEPTASARTDEATQTH